MNNYSLWNLTVLPLLRRDNVTAAEDAYVAGWVKTNVAPDVDPVFDADAFIDSVHSELWFTLEVLVRGDKVAAFQSLQAMFGVSTVAPERIHVVPAPWIDPLASVHTPLFASSVFGNSDVVRDLFRRAACLAARVGAADVIRATVFHRWDGILFARMVFEAALSSNFNESFAALRDTRQACSTSAQSDASKSMIAITISSTSVMTDGLSVLNELLLTTQLDCTSAAVQRSNEECESTFGTAYRHAVMRGDASTVSVLVQAGVDISGFSGVSLLTAVITKNESLVQTLVDGRVADTLGDIAFRTAASYGYVDVTRVLYTPVKARRHRELIRFWVNKRRERGLPTLSDSDFEEIFG